MQLHLGPNVTLFDRKNAQSRHQSGISLGLQMGLDGKRDLHPNDPRYKDNLDKTERERA